MADTVTVLKTKTKCELCKVQPGKYSVSRETRDELGTVSETNVGGADKYMVVCLKCLHSPCEVPKVEEPKSDLEIAEDVIETEEKEKKSKKKSKKKKEKKEKEKKEKKSKSK
eukprot:TRINITY_DN263_c0_g1_i6.p1 TRINITY_DN263_c0_g1~~TRINITY_DN263_c0_g1_i6.p1  ORF type:complete len:112 (-),score=41.43 TRINITY_DN263_c0_g1_i6:247-582(-)